MRILMVHNRYRIRGGEDETVDAEMALLERNGIDVDKLILHNDAIDDRMLLKVAVNTVWCHKTYLEVSRRLRDGLHDIIHVHNFFPQISPSIHWAARTIGVPVVQGLHNYRLECLNGFFFREGATCEACHHRLPWRGILRRCYRNSGPGSATVGAMLAAHRLIRTWQTKVDVFVTPSEHARRKLAAVVPGERIVVKPDFVADGGIAGSGEGGFALYVGRLSPEKGIGTLLRAWRRADTALPQLLVVGDGPLASKVEKAAQAGSRIRFLGWKRQDEVLQLMARAKLLVFPSEWAETFGRTVMEAFSVGTPVACSSGGAHSELVEEGITGAIFAAGNADDLTAAVCRILHAGDRYGIMRDHARCCYLARFTPERNLRATLDIYARAQAEHAGNGFLRSLA